MPARRLWWLALGVLTALLLVVLGPLAYVAIRSDHRVTTAESAPAEPVALVLGASVRRDGSPSAALKDRLDTALELYRAGKARVLLVSGDNRTADYNEPAAMRSYLVHRGVPADRVVEDFAGRSTYDSCYRAHAIFGVERMLVVSQRYHLPRAVATCRSLGVEVTGVTRGPANNAMGRPAAREIPAAMKLSLDLITSRQPVLGSPETTVAFALDGSDRDTGMPQPR